MLVAPRAGKQAMTETDRVNPQETLERRRRLDDFDIGVRDCDRWCRPRHARAPVAALADGEVSADGLRGSTIVNSVNSPRGCRQ